MKLVLKYKIHRARRADCSSSGLCQYLGDRIALITCDGRWYDVRDGKEMFSELTQEERDAMIVAPLTAEE